MEFLKRWSCFVMNLIFFVVIRGQSARYFMYIEFKSLWKKNHFQICCKRKLCKKVKKKNNSWQNWKWFLGVWESCSYHKNSKNTKASSPFQIASIICSNQRKINLVRVVTSINHSKLSAYLPPHPILTWWVKHQSTFWTWELKSFMIYTNEILFFLPRNQINEKTPFLNGDRNSPF